MKSKLPFLLVCTLTVAFLQEARSNPLAKPEVKSPEAETLYRQNCSHCHSGNAPSAPRIGDTQAWTSRLSGGFNQLYNSAINGIPNTAMIAKGGHQELSDEQVKLLIAYMLSKSNISSKTISQALSYDNRKITDREFILLDKNKNGLLDKHELQDQAVYSKSLASFDKNKDGALSPTEFIELRTFLETSRQSMKVSDEEITQLIKLTTSNIQGMPQSGIRVNTKDSNVTIAGVVGSNEIIAKIWQSIRWIPGIKSFDNRLMTSEMLAFD